MLVLSEYDQSERRHQDILLPDKMHCHNYPHERVLTWTIHRIKIPAAFKFSAVYRQSKGIIIKKKYRPFHPEFDSAFYPTLQHTAIMILQLCTKDAQCCTVKYYERQKNKQSWLCLPSPGETALSKQFRWKSHEKTPSNSRNFVQFLERNKRYEAAA